MNKQEVIAKIDKPKGVNRLSNSEVLNGKSITAIERIKLMSPDEYEDFILEWVDGFMQDKYDEVIQLGGSGDKGRDIIGYIDKEKTRCDYYQCKHYDKQLTPTDIYIELGKVIYYTFHQIIPLPMNHYFVAPKGEGPALHDLLIKPDELKAELKSQWEKYVQNKITNKSINLDGELLQYLDAFDFSIFGVKQPLTIIKEHRETVWYPGRFGGGLVRTRNKILKPTQGIEEFEMIYVQQLFEVYTEYGGAIISKKEDLLTIQELKEHFDNSRNCFFSAESLKQFSRDNLPPNVNAFGDLKDEVHATIRNIILMEQSNGFTRLLNSSQAAITAQYLNNPLCMEIKAKDKEGVCHHLANENKVKWVKKGK